VLLGQGSRTPRKPVVHEFEQRGKPKNSGENNVLSANSSTTDLL
jgi:hypothetical protein